ncbi:tetratricopeptide repeat protein [Acaryochloris sp. CCMEE 5410]|uniref:tetratricopeptide repeat protein n=1 Tax=Acaryochloris sp. CCMEE 5410 TaxID=310037 RepID=UPI0002484E42|nr:tetratricopeptide repeat protein [Acaryochloris sp. CCMEE 5410]KAI9134432.1 tetratricopeptide repeat protein [Acaryochloris sp. CCMEE 5410]
MLRQRLPKSLLASIVVSSLALISIQSTIARPNSYPSKTHPTAIIFSKENQSQKYLLDGIQKALSGDYPGAIEAYDLALQFAPANAEAYYNRGVAYFSIGHSDNALQDFERAISITPSMAEAYGNRGTIRLQMGEYKSALSDFQTAADLFEQEDDHISAEAMRSLIHQNTAQP